MENKPAVATEAPQEDFKPWEAYKERSQKLAVADVGPEGDVPPWVAIQNNIASGAAFLRNITMPPSMSKNVYKYDGKQAAKEMDFEEVFANLIQAETRGRHTDASGKLTTSPVGAQGITQVMPKTAKDPGYGVKPIKDSSEGEYLRFGREYLGAMVKEFNGDYRKALAAYNFGPGSVRKAIMKAAKAGHDDWLSLTPKETKDYVRKILKGDK